MPLPFVPGMIATGIVRAGAAFAIGMVGHATAARSQAECLSSTDTQEMVAEKKAVAPSAALRAARGHAAGGETLRARLCHHNDQLVYWVTVLMRNGKVGRVLIDAASGDVIEMR